MLAPKTARIGRVAEGTHLAALSAPRSGSLSFKPSDSWGPFKFLNFQHAVYALFIANLASEREGTRLGTLALACFAVRQLFIEVRRPLGNRNPFGATRASDSPIMALRYFVNHSEPH